MSAAFVTDQSNWCCWCLAQLLERANHVDRRRKDADLLVRLTQSGVEESGIDWIDPSAGERDLPAMAGDMVGAADVDDMQFAAAFEIRMSAAAALVLLASALSGSRSDGRKLAPDSLDLEVERRVVGHRYR